MDNHKIVEIYGSSHSTGRSCHFPQVAPFWLKLGGGIAVTEAIYLGCYSSLK